MAVSVGGVEREADLEDVYYVPDVHVRLLLMGKLESQGWVIRLKDGAMELWDRLGDLFAVISKSNNVYLVKLTIVTPDSGFAAWLGKEVGTDQSPEDVVKHINDYALLTTAKGVHSSDTSLLTWHCRLGHPSFKTVVELLKGGVSGMVITDVPEKIPGLDVCAACVAGKSLHLLHKEGRMRVMEFLERVHIDIAGLMPVASVGGHRYIYVVIDDYSHAVYSQPLRVKSEAPEAFKLYKASAEKSSGKKIREVMTDNACKLCMGEMLRFCEEEGIKINTMVPYHPASNGVAERTIGVLTSAVRAMLHDMGLPKNLWAEAYNTVTHVPQ